MLQRALLDMEISPLVCQNCFHSDKVAPFTGAETSFGQVVALLTNLPEKYLSEKDFGHLAVASRELYFR